MDEVAIRVDGAVRDAGSAVPDVARAFTVTEFHQLLDEAVRSAGLVHLWVTGTVTGLRPGPKFTTFELVDYEDDGAMVHAVLSVGVFARFGREIRKTLAVAGAELVDGLQVSVWGPLDLNPRYGRLRILAQRVDPRTTVGAAVLARDERAGRRSGGPGPLASAPRGGGGNRGHERPWRSRRSGTGR
jgi:exonuclease VII large subunit